MGSIKITDHKLRKHLAAEAARLRALASTLRSDPNLAPKEGAHEWHEQSKYAAHRLDDAADLIERCYECD
jgi:hypothetical protein